jgi:hypothetical protein
MAPIQPGNTSPDFKAHFFFFWLDMCSAATRSAISAVVGRIVLPVRKEKKK